MIRKRGWILARAEADVATRMLFSLLLANMVAPTESRRLFYCKTKMKNTTMKQPCFYFSKNACLNFFSLLSTHSHFGGVRRLRE